MKTLKTALIVLGVIFLLFGILLGAPIIVFPVAAILGVMVVTAQHHDRPIAAEASEWGRRWHVWMAGAAVLFVLGGSMLFTSDDGELSSVAWLVWILSWVSAAVVAVVGLGLGATRFVQQRQV